MNHFASLEIFMRQGHRTKSLFYDKQLKIIIVKGGGGGGGGGDGKFLVRQVRPQEAYIMRA